MSVQSHWRYLRYVVRHKWFVFVAGRKTRAPLWRLLIHDWSKFTPSEWSAYVATFYGADPQDIAQRWYQRQIGAMHVQGAIISDGEREYLTRQEQWKKARITEARAAAFDAAWLHHQHTNPHHWQHWMLREDSGAVKLLPMPEHFVREMVADWMGAGRAITGRWEAGEWYQQNRHIIQLEQQTRYRVEKLLALHAGLRCYCGALASPSYCRDDLGGCEAYCSAFSVNDLTAMGSNHPRANQKVPA